MASIWRIFFFFFSFILFSFNFLVVTLVFLGRYEGFCHDWAFMFFSFFLFGYGLWIPSFYTPPFSLFL
jgi:hypothetical protein